MQVALFVLLGNELLTGMYIVAFLTPEGIGDVWY
jgi:hypothetical protein